MELVTSLEEFEFNLKNLAEKGFDLQKPVIATEATFQNIVSNVRNWRKESIDFLKNSFLGDRQTYFSTQFHNAGASNLSFPNLPLYQKSKNLKDSLQQSINSLMEVPKILRISDAIIDPQRVKDELREKWTINRKKEFILSVLFKLGQNYHYDVNYLYWANGLVETSSQEPYHVAHSLYDSGLIELYGGTWACINLHGITYLEELPEQSNNVNTGIGEDQNDIDEINEKLTRLEALMNQNNYGNEIIYDELLELRKNSTKLNLKNWKQLATGKLLALHYSVAEDQAKEKIKDMFNYIVENGSNLLGS